jgi:hypothetical protein
MPPTVASRRTDRHDSRSCRSAACWIACLIAILSCSPGYRVEQTVGGVRIVLSTATHPLRVGPNDLRVEVTDPSGPVTGGDVTVRYRLPKMPGMAELAYKADAVTEGDTIRLSMNAHTAGTWTVEVTVDRRGTAPITVRFPLAAEREPAMPPR